MIDYFVFSRALLQKYAAVRDRRPGWTVERLRSELPPAPESFRENFESMVGHRIARKSGIT